MATSPIDLVHGTVTFELRLNWLDIPVTRDVSLSRDDTCGHWLAVVAMPGHDHEPDYEHGAISISDPAVITFVEQFVLMLASPDKFIPKPKHGPVAIPQGDAA